jgi:hypothetical protein
MRATDFEYRHQTLLHLLVVGCAFLMYIIQRDDVVWFAVKHHVSYRAFLERLVFGAGALIILVSAILQTWAFALHFGSGAETSAVAYRYRKIPSAVYFGRLLFTVGLGQLAPVCGTVVLLTGESILVLRLLRRNSENIVADFISSRKHFSNQGFGLNWKEAFRKQASQWGLAVTMIVFTVTLQDRVAEMLAGASVLLWAVLNMRRSKPNLL